MATTVRNLVIPDPVTQPSNTAVQEAARAAAVRILRAHAVRGIPAGEDGTAVGVLSIRDLTAVLDEDSAYAHTSATGPND